MISDKKVLGIIPARGGSKSIPGKNIAPLGGKPLIAWTIERAKSSRYIDRLILSSEDKAIIDVAKTYGCEVPFVRPAELAQDDTPGIAPVLHALKQLKETYDYILLLQPTSPFRSTEDIDRSLEFVREHKAPFCVSLTLPDKSPYWMYRLDEKRHITPLLKTEAVRRQDLPTAYVLNGAIYIAEVDNLLKTESFITDETLGYVMPPERSLDIDSETDLKFCNWLLSQS